MHTKTMWSLIITIAVLETIGMSIIEDSANKRNMYFIIGLGFYMIVGIILGITSGPLSEEQMILADMNCDGNVVR